MKPILYRYKDTESVIKVMDGYTPGEGWAPLYSQAQVDELQAQLVYQQASYEAEIKVEIDIAREQTVHDMNIVAEKYAHKLALDLECILADYSGKWWETAMQTLGDYRSAMNAIHERESPTFLGEPRL